MSQEDISTTWAWDVKNLAMAEEMMRTEHIQKTILGFILLVGNTDAFDGSRLMILYLIRYDSHAFSGGSSDVVSE